MTTKSDTPGQAAIRRLVEQARTAQGLTQKDLAAAADISNKTFFNFSSGATWPLPRALRGMERALGFTPFVLDDVLEHEDPESITLDHVVNPDEPPTVAADLTDSDLIFELTVRLDRRNRENQKLTEELALLRQDTE